jgi:short chain dehydrogenase
VLGLNLQRPFTLTQKLLPLLLKSKAPRIIHIGSISALGVPSLETYAYSASKAGLHHLSRVLAVKLGERGVRVNTIACGPFESKMMKETLDKVDLPSYRLTISTATRSSLEFQSGGLDERVTSQAHVSSSHLKQETSSMAQQSPVTAVQSLKETQSYSKYSKHRFGMNAFARRYDLKSSRQILFQPFLDGVHEFAGDDPGFTVGATARESQILSHDSVFVDCVDAGLFDCLGKGNQFLISVKFASVLKTSSPREDPVISKELREHTKQWG